MRAYLRVSFDKTYTLCALESGNMRADVHLVGGYDHSIICAILGQKRLKVTRGTVETYLFPIPAHLSFAHVYRHGNFTMLDNANTST